MIRRMLAATGNTAARNSAARNSAALRTAVLRTAVWGIVLGCAASAVQAGGGWHVDLFYGGGGHHHHHHGWHGHYWYPRPYVYVAPAPVVYTAPPVVYTQPVVNVPAAAATTAPAPAVASTVRSNPTPATRSAGVTLRNPSSTGTTIAFVVDSRSEAQLAPGEALPLNDKSAYFVEFDRGGDFGTSKRTLTEGTYEFVATDAGWDLRRADAADAVPTPTPTPLVRRNTLPATR